MLISPPSARKRIRAFSLITLVSSISLVCGCSHAANRQQLSGALILPEEVKQDALNLLKGDPSYPSSEGIAVSITGDGIISTDFPAPGTFIAPIKISYPDLSNSYCLLAIYSKDKPTLLISKIPNSDNCEKWKLMGKKDLNSDGIDDLIFSESLSSNRYPTTVTEPRVFLSDKSENRMCYSDIASDEAASLSLIQLSSEDGLKSVSNASLRCASLKP